MGQKHLSQINSVKIALHFFFFINTRYNDDKLVTFKFNISHIPTNLNTSFYQLDRKICIDLVFCSTFFFSFMLLNLGWPDGWLVYCVQWQTCPLCGVFMPFHLFTCTLSRACMLSHDVTILYHHFICVCCPPDKCPRYPLSRTTGPWKWRNCV